MVPCRPTRARALGLFGSSLSAPVMSTRPPHRSRSSRGYPWRHRKAGSGNDMCVHGSKCPAFPGAWVFIHLCHLSEQISSRILCQTRSVSSEGRTHRPRSPAACSPCVPARKTDTFVALRAIGWNQYSSYPLVRVLFQTCYIAIVSSYHMVLSRKHMGSSLSNEGLTGPDMFTV